MIMVNVRMAGFVTMLISWNTKYDRCDSKQTTSRSRIRRQWTVGTAKTTYLCKLNTLHFCYIESNTPVLKCSCILQNVSGDGVCVSMKMYISNNSPLNCFLYASSSMTFRPNFGTWFSGFRVFETIMVLGGDKLSPHSTPTWAAGVFLLPRHLLQKLWNMNGPNGSQVTTTDFSGFTAVHKLPLSRWRFSIHFILL